MLSRVRDDGPPCRIDNDGEDPEALETVLVLNMLGFRMGTGPLDGEEERGEEVPAILSLMDTKDDDEEFMLSFLNRFNAKPEGEVFTPMFAVPGFMEGNGLGGGIKALLPVLALVPIEEGNMNLSATVILSTPGKTVPPADVVRAICIGGDRDVIDLTPLLEGNDDPEMESRWRFFSSVGTNSPRSREVNPKDSKDSRSSSWKLGLSR